MNEVGYVKADKIDLAKEFMVSGGDLLIAMTGATIGKMGMVPEYNSEILVNQRVGKFFLGVNPYEKIAYLYCLLHQNNVYEKIVGRGDGSAQPNVSPSQIESITVVQPPKEIINQFNKTFMNNFKIWTKLLKENELLKQTRDTLLPKLMSGEVEV
jgi:type I restriction enzyme, S subunit